MRHGGGRRPAAQSLPDGRGAWSAPAVTGVPESARVTGGTGGWAEARNGGGRFKLDPEAFGVTVTSGIVTVTGQADNPPSHPN